ncbi:MAG TPA: hypothetical protein VFC24_16190 [Casimicrobiaceae bacterium]|nr:hypothetical protein [Casimicrobiaceae bacterium]
MPEQAIAALVPRARVKSIMVDESDKSSPDSTKDALIAVMEELAAILDPVPDGPLPANIRARLAEPLARARELAAALDGQSGPTSAYLLTLSAIEQRIAGATPGGSRP